MSTYDTLVKPLSQPSKFKAAESASGPAAAPPMDSWIPTEPERRIPHNPAPEISDADRSFRRLLLADAALSVAGTVAAVLILPDFPPTQAAWLGFASVNFALWTGVAVAGACLIVCGRIAGPRATPRPNVPPGTKARLLQPVEEEFTFN